MSAKLGTVGFGVFPRGDMCAAINGCNHVGLTAACLHLGQILEAVDAFGLFATRSRTSCAWRSLVAT